MTRSARRRHQYAVDLPGYVALETADDLPLALALRGAPRALCSDIGPLHLLSSGEGRVGHSEPHGAMLERSHRGSGPISLTTALEGVAEDLYVLSISLTYHLCELLVVEVTVGARAPGARRIGCVWQLSVDAYSLGDKLEVFFEVLEATHIVGQDVLA